MFCFACGKQIRDDASFCQYCGVAQSKSSISTTNTNTIVQHTTSNHDYDREALKIYLGDVLSLECIKAKFLRKISDYDANIQNIKDNNYYKRCLLKSFSNLSSDKKYVHLMYKDGNYYIGSVRGCGSRLSPWYEPLLRDNAYSEGYCWEWRRLPKNNPVEELNNPATWKYAAQVSAGLLKKHNQQVQLRDAFLTTFGTFESEAPQIYSNNLEKMNNFIHMKNGTQKELVAVRNLLKQAYDVNIIPSNFRNNIHAIYYLHDFVSTSRESFTTALLHFDLNEIKVKLDKIINQQETMIIQNAIMMSQNDKLMDQNRQKLEKLAQIEGNTSQSAKYAKIAANNSEICSWILLSDYIKR